MVVNIKTEFNKRLKNLNSHYKNRICLGISGYSQLFLYSFLFCYPSFSIAGPTGGNIVGGNGHIHVSGLTTDIHQNTSSLAINWDSYNIKANEVVNYLQPGSSSIALNRILSNRGSQILGQINANGQVVLVNPNGIFFGSSATVNVGGLIASGLDIKPVDFMNGNYVFSSIDGTSGTVINGGILNASLGGNGGGSISLIGRQVTNNGLISAHLGAVNLAAGKEAVLTFDNEGLMGVKITKEVLQNELGVDPAVLNRGEISAESGRVLLTASQSQDIFSQAVNSKGIEQATSVVVNADGTFTLGGGADIVNSGVVDVSAVDSNAGQVVLLGDNITSSGTIKADSVNANGGEIELHSMDTTLLTENSSTSARSEQNGRGGNIKVFGNKVGLLNQSSVDASGANGGGNVLLGGDKKGENKLVRNAEFLYIAENTLVKANALDNGNGGNVIAFSDNTSRIYSSLQAKGGLNSGNGGFIETSGKLGLVVTKAGDASASNGEGGLWLIDPRNVDIVSSYTDNNCADTAQCPEPPGANFSASVNNTEILASELVKALVNNGTGVSIDTGSTGSQAGDITIKTSIDYDGVGNNTLTLNAANDITFNSNRTINDGDLSSADSLNLNLYANGDIVLNNNVIIDTNGGDFTVGFIDSANANNNIIPTSFSSYNSGTGDTATINTSGVNHTDSGGNQTNAGKINITASGAVSINTLTSVGGNTGTSSNASGDRKGRDGGDITIKAASVVVNAAIDSSGSAGRFDTNRNGDNGVDGGNGGFVNITSTAGNVTVAAITTNGESAAGDYNGTIDTGNGGDAGKIDLTASAGNTITLNGDLTAQGGMGYIDGNNGSLGDGANVTLTENVVLANNIVIDTLGFRDSGQTNGADGAIWFKNNITADANVNDRTLELISGLSNTTIDGSIGAGANNALQDFKITSSNIASVNAITTLDGNGAVTINGSNSIDLGGDITTNAGTETSGGNVSLVGAVTLSADVTINTNDTVSSGVVDFSSTINSANTTLRTLTVDAGTATVDFNAAVGGGTGVQGLLINNGSTITTAAVTTDVGGFKANGTDLVLGGNIVTNAGVVDLDSVNNLQLTNSISTSGGTVFIDVTSTTTGSNANGGYFKNDASNDSSISTGAGSVNISTAGSDGNNRGVMLGAITTTDAGALSVTTTNGSIEQSTTAARDLDINAISGFDAGSSDIILNNTSNNFIGAVSFTSSGDVSVIDSNSILLGASTVGASAKTFTVDARNNGIIQQLNGSALTVNGAALLKTNNGNITVNNTGNDFTGAVSVENAGSNSITVGGDNNITLGASILSGGTYTVNAGADINVSAAIDPTGSTSTLVLNADNDVNILADPLLAASAGSLVMTFNSDVDTAGGGQINLNTASTVRSGGGAITFNGATVLQQNSAVNASTGKIDFINTVDGVAARGQSLTLSAGDVDFGANIGLSNTSSRLGDITITSTGAINAGTNTITAKSLNVIQSNSFTSGDIDTSGSGIDATDTTIAQVIINSITNIISGDISTFGAPVAIDTVGLAGGNVTLAANNIAVGAIDAHGSNASGAVDNLGGAAGDVSITATELITPSVVAPSITLNGDFNVFNGDAVTAGAVVAGLSKTAQLSLVSTSAGSVNIGYTGVFTSLLDISGDVNSLDTIYAANIATNTWNITGAEIGDLNTKISFNDFENLTGNTGVDEFTFTTNTAFIDGLIDGGTGSGTEFDKVTLFTGDTAGRIVQLANTASLADNILEVNNIETIVADSTAGLTNELRGENTASNWFINAPGAGSMGDTSLVQDAAGPAEGVVVFSNFNVLTGGIAADTFNILINNILTDTVTGMTVNGGTGVPATDTAQFDTLVGPNIDTKWSITQQNGGKLVDKNTAILSVDFYDIENLTAGSGSDTFAFSAGIDVDGDIDAGAGIDDIDFSGDLGVVIFDIAGGVNSGSRKGFEKVTGNGFNSTLIGDTTNVWNITDSNSGTVGTLIFAAFNNLTGGSGDDTFNMIDDGVTRGNITGLIDGAGGTNTLDIYTPANLFGAGTGAAVIVQLGSVKGVSNLASDSNQNGAIDVANLNQVNASTAFANEIRAGIPRIVNSNNINYGPNNWVVTGDQTGTFNTSLVFNGFATLTGADAVIDNFSVTASSLPNQMTFNGGVSADATEFDTLKGANITSKWTVTGADSGSLTEDPVPAVGPPAFNVAFNGIESLSGGTGIDNFVLTTGSLRGTINGGTGAALDTLTGGAGTAGINTWNITQLNQGTVDGVGTDVSNTFGFTDIESLIGSSGIDRFTLNNGASLSGSINGGAGSAVDEIISNYSAAITNWNITGNNQGNVVGISNFTEIEKLTGADNVIDTFTLAEGGVISDSVNGGLGATDEIINQQSSATAWIINGTNQGSVAGIAAFTGVEKLSGAATVVDTFGLANNGLITDSINGGGGAFIDEVFNIQTVATSWSINGNNQGDISSAAGTSNFVGIEKLSGAANIVDTFNLFDGGIISDSVNGGVGGSIDEIISQLTAATTGWNITGTNQGDIAGFFSFTEVEKLTGGAQIDNFVMQTGGTLSGTIDGGAGEDTLTADNVANTWVINGANQGNVNGIDNAATNIAYDFTGIENITGGSLDDDFTFYVNSSISGIVNGGSENRNTSNDLVGRGDTVDMSAVDIVDIVIGATPLSATGMNIVSIEEVTGNGADSTLTGQEADVANGDITNSWALFDSTGAGGTINDGTVSNENGVVKFINFTALLGSNRNDRFELSPLGTLSMAIDGRTEQSADQLDFSKQLGDVVVNLNDVPNSTIKGIEGVIGNNNRSTLIAKNGRTNIWVINGVNDGTLNLGDPESVIFTDFNILVGADGIDNFTIENTGSIGDQTFPALDLNSGISGGDSVDTLTTAFTDDTASYIRFDGGVGNDRVTVNLNGNQNGSITFNTAAVNTASGDDILVIQSSSTNYVETYTANVGGFDQLVYTNGANTYTVNYSNINNGSVNDNVNADSLSINGSADANFVDNIILNTADFQVNTNTLVNYTNKRSLFVDGLGGADIINIDSALDFGGGRVELTAQTITGANSASVITADDLLLDASTSIGNGTAVIGDAANALRTNVTNLRLVGIDGSLYLTEQNALNINELSNNSGTLNIVAGGSVSDAADLQSTANIDITSNTGSIFLDSINNLLSGDLSLSANTVTVNNTTTTRLNNIAATTLNVTTAAGSIIDTGTVQATGLSTLSASSDILLDGPNLNLATVDINAANDVTIENSVNVLNVTDINASGVVIVNSGALNATGNISGSTVTLDSAGATTTVNTINATGAVRITSTGVTATGGIVGGSVMLDAAAGNISFNDIVTNTGGITVTGNNVSQAGAMASQGDVLITSAGAFNMTVGASTVTSGGFTVNGTGQIGLQAVTAANDIYLEATNTNINVNSSINFNAASSSLQGNLTAITEQSILVNGNLSAMQDINLTATNGTVIQNAALSSTQGNINVSSGLGISMGGSSSSSASAGNIQYIAENSVAVTSLSAAGKVEVRSNTAAITDANFAAMNFVANTLQLRAVNGIGSGNPLESRVAVMDVINTGNGEVNFQQTGNVALVALQNTGSVGNIDFRSDGDISFNPGSVDANRNTGLLFMRTSGGSYLGLLQSNLNNPDITARDASFFAPRGNFGSFGRLITLDVPGSVFIDVRALFEPRFVPPGPSNLETRGVNFSIRGAISAIASEQLVEIETLAEVDEAIFTDLQNYSLEEISIRMPRDQLFEDELEESEQAAF